jgi:hypothetical protein
MPEDNIIHDETYVYECLNCGFKSEPPWKTPPQRSPKTLFVNSFRSVFR